jgi:hypothetical protein
MVKKALNIFLWTAGLNLRSNIRKLFRLFYYLDKIELFCTLNSSCRYIYIYICLSIFKNQNMVRLFKSRTRQTRVVIKTLNKCWIFLLILYRFLLFVAPTLLNFWYREVNHALNGTKGQWGGLSSWEFLFRF